MQVSSRATALSPASDVNGTTSDTLTAGALETSRTPRAAVDFHVDAAFESDHSAIHGLLLATFQEPTIGTFQAINNSPRYEPSDRLLVRLGKEIVAHVFLNRRTMYFGGCELISTDLRYLVTLPEFRARGLGTELMRAAIEEMQHSRTVVATSRTLMPGFFEGHGWVRCGKRCYSVANTHDVLAHLEATKRPHESKLLWSAAGKQLAVRVMRMSELDASSAIYDAQQENTYGSYHRTSSDWRWLLATRPHDRVYATFELDPAAGEVGPDEAPQGRMVGYAVVKDHRIIELSTKSRMQGAERALLWRICRDAVENGRHAVEIHGPPNLHLHALFAAAGGRYGYSDRDGGRVLMAKILDTQKFLQEIRPLLWERARMADVPAGTALGLQCGDETWRVTVNKRSIAIKAGDPGPRMVATDYRTLCQLLMGHVSAAEMINAGLVQTDDLETANLARILLPQVPLWRPVFDDVDG